MWCAATLLALPLAWLTIVDRQDHPSGADLPSAEIAWRDDGSVSLDVRHPHLLPDDVHFTDTHARFAPDTLGRAGIAIGVDTHVSILPPYVVLTREHESITVERRAHRLRTDGPLPSWVRREDSSRLVVELAFDLYAVIDRRGLRLHRGDVPSKRG